MKRIHGVYISFLLFCYESHLMAYQPLKTAPTTIEKFHEIATQYNSAIAPLYNELTAQERVFAYYIFRASLPGNRIAADQYHRHSLAIIQLCETLFLNETQLRELNWVPLDVHTRFMQELKTYLVYFWANHSQYFAKEHVDEKRTPSRMNLTLLTEEKFNHALNVLGRDDLVALLAEVAPSLFDCTHEKSCCVADNIKESAGNFYAPDFTEEDYQALPAHERTHLNAYYYIKDENGERTPTVERYRIGGKYSPELAVSAHWLEKALHHAQAHQKSFDKPLVNSLAHLIAFLRSGDEQDFRKHSIEWLKSNNRLDYLFGFIENYQDPKEYRGSFEAEITVKAIDMQTLNELLPQLERQLPFPEKFKREGLDTGAGMPNASINSIIFGAGQAGPLQVTAAYCLPNYEDIRSTYGSKQIIYQAEKGLGALLNPALYKQLFYLKEHASFLAQHDAEGKLGSDIWNIHCILHETLGHGSGRLDVHTFAEGDPLAIDGTSYTVNDTLALTPANSNPFFAGVGQSLEELRAEIIALYTSIFMFDELAQAGLYKDWPEKIGKEKFIEWLIYDMAGTGLRRLQSQPIGNPEISGSHAQANTIIMNYLLDSGSLALIEEKQLIGGTEHTVLGFKITDLEKACDTIKELAIIVQTIKSTADGIQFKKLLDTYGRFVRNLAYPAILQNNMKAVVGDLKAAAYIYPRLTPMRDEQGKILDIQADWPASFIEQALEHRELALSYE